MIWYGVSFTYTVRLYCGWCTIDLVRRGRSVLPHTHTPTRHTQTHTQPRAIAVQWVGSSLSSSYSSLCVSVLTCTARRTGATGSPGNSPRRQCRRRSGTLRAPLLRRPPPPRRPLRRRTWSPPCSRRQSPPCSCLGLSARRAIAAGLIGSRAASGSGQCSACGRTAGRVEEGGEVGEAGEVPRLRSCRLRVGVERETAAAAVAVAGRQRWSVVVEAEEEGERRWQGGRGRGHPFPR